MSTIPDENLVGIVIEAEEGNRVLAFAPWSLIKVGFDEAVFQRQVLKMKSVAGEIFKDEVHIWEGFLYIWVQANLDDLMKDNEL